MTRSARDTIIDVLGVVFDPRFWIRNYDVDHDWSDFLEKKLDEGWEPVTKSTYTVPLGDGEVWIENWPHAYGKPYNGFPAEGLPRRRTAIRLRKSVKRIFE